MKYGEKGTLEMITLQADNIRRLNTMLELPQVDIDALQEAGWNQLLDQLYWAIFAERNRVYREDVFHQAASRLGVRAAQEGLRGQLSLLQRAKPQQGPLLLENLPSFELAKQTLYLLVDEEGFLPRYVSTDFPTMSYQMLSYLIDRLKLRPSDFLTCANEKCRRVFVPLRKPHRADKKHFCSQKCGNLISARVYRKKKADELRKKERKRNRRRSANGDFEMYRMKRQKRGKLSGPNV